MRALPPDLAAAIARAGEGLTLLVVHCGPPDGLVPALPAVRQLRFHLPDARIEWACDEAYLPILEGHRDLEAIHPVPVGRWRGLARIPSGWRSLAREWAGLRARLRASSPGAAVVLDESLLGGLVASSSSAPVRVGGGRLATHRVPPDSALGLPRVESYRRLVRVFGVPDGPLPLAGLRAAASARRAARRILASAARGGSGAAVIDPGPGGRRGAASPPVPLLVAAARRAAAISLAPIVLSTSGSEGTASEIVRLAGDSAVLAPAIDLPVLVALLSEARLFVGGHSSAMQIACGVGCPVVAMHDSADPDAGAPWGRSHRSLSGPAEALTPEAVSEAVGELIDETAEGGIPIRDPL